ncbi:MAG TPA: pantoate--beta-alanine ligase [Aggregatilineales bacterium]|nr:pantoate--beta-alanine ligase [Chloroflexota bacterium]HOA23594.1 pantoate--beta-alanine ligase [Aggregatilineales bacterium]HPV05525.1 pantoate--beta-alanine ligase [Aggregatilineales bacterium]HQA68760.1 pantoate--beta-alanine ligase [Aggregatilineales bacterium]
MQVVQTIDEVRAIRRADPLASWGLVPTMGALHEGHLSLVRQARQENDRVAVSVFVNPKQFNNPDDLARYPRDLERDIALLEREGVDLVWAPTEAIMYPPDFQTTVTVAEVAKPLEGAYRPGHFQGVATVVAKLFNVVEPTRAYFGQKDAQQVVVIRQMVRDLGFNLEVRVCPTVREPDGLALSSRNALLNPAEREAATVLFRALSAAVEEWQDGWREAQHLREIMADIIEAERLARLEYVSVADPVTLAELEGDVERALLSMAVYIGDVRLIDNMLVGEE